MAAIAEVQPGPKCTSTQFHGNLLERKLLNCAIVAGASRQTRGLIRAAFVSVLLIGMHANLAFAGFVGGVGSLWTNLRMDSLTSGTQGDGGPIPPKRGFDATESLSNGAVVAYSYAHGETIFSTGQVGVLTSGAMQAEAIAPLSRVHDPYLLLQSDITWGHQGAVGEYIYWETQYELEGFLAPGDSLYYSLWHDVRDPQSSFPIYTARWYDVVTTPGAFHLQFYDVSPLFGGPVAGRSAWRQQTEIALVIFKGGSGVSTVMFNGGTVPVPEPASCSLALFAALGLFVASHWQRERIQGTARPQCRSSQPWNAYAIVRHTG